MAAGLGFKDFTTGEVLTAADVDGYLMQGIWVFADAAARSAAVTSPQEGNYSFLKDTNSTEYYTGSAWVAAGGGGGKVLQVVQGTLATAASTTSSSFVATGLTATITPSSATSKILVIVNHIAWMNANASRADAYFRVLRGATSISGSRNMPYLDTPDNIIDMAVGFNYSILDNPATTSATTYSTEYQRGLSGVSIGVAMDNTTDTIVLMEIGA